MKSLSKWITLLAFMPLLSGCIENAVLVTVNPDGSGILTVRLLSASELGDLGAFGEMKVDGESAPAPEAPSLKELLSDASQFGEGVELVSVKDVTNASGWKGAMATYSFSNIETLQFKPTKVEQENEASESSSSMPIDADIEYAFKFTPGKIATLSIVPVIEGSGQAEGEEVIVAGSEEDPFAQAGLEDSEPVASLGGVDGGMEDMGKSIATAMMASMAPMMKGMRISYLVRINGEIQETNARHRPRDNTILVLDMNVDKLLTDASMMDKMSGGLEELSALANSDHPAIKMQDPKDPIVITFR